LIRGRDERFFSSQKRPDRLWGPLSPLFSGPYGFLPAVQQARCELDRSLPSMAEFKNEMIYTSAPPSVASMRG